MYHLNLGARLFTISEPVLAFGICASIVYGVPLRLGQMFQQRKGLTCVVKPQTVGKVVYGYAKEQEKDKAASNR